MVHHVSMRLNDDIYTDVVHVASQSKRNFPGMPASEVRQNHHPRNKAGLKQGGAA